MNDVVDTIKQLPDSPKPPAKHRIKPALREAIRLMIWEALPRALAAQRAGMTDHGLYQALQRPHVQKLYNQEFTRLKDGSAVRAFINIVDLADNATSQDVRLRANTWLAGVAGIAPAQKVQVQGQVNHHFTGFDYGPAMVEGEATAVED